MKRIVFYSWQSDLANACNRGFIQDALENAAAAIVADETVAIEPVVDRDTQGVPGSPDIASTIFAKITAADVFVADISITGRPNGGRAAPNPNVLIELGYAFKALGHERVILVFNRAFGKIEELPFDLRMRRVVPYDMAAEANERAPEKRKLEKVLESAIRSALEQIPDARETTPTLPAVNAIENSLPNRIVVIRRSITDIFQRLQQLQPRRHRDGGTADELIAAINLTQEPIADFSKIAEAIAMMNDIDAAAEVYRWFGKIFEEYSITENFSGRYTDADFDYFRFVGHELFVTLISFLLREHRWDTISRLLAEPIPMRYIRNEQGAGNASWECASRHLPLLLNEGAKRQRLSLHADILQERHTKGGGLAEILPFDDFVAADYFLYLFGELSSGNGPELFMTWRPWSTLYLHRAPMFLRNAEHKPVADALVRLTRVSDVDQLKKRLIECVPLLEKLFSNGIWMQPITKQDIDRIGTR